MNPDRWKQVSRIYGAVLTKPEAARAAALAELCADDGELRREVESLLASGTEVPILDRAAADPPSVMAMMGGVVVGYQIGVFRITGFLGVGGMGEVYRARDTKLNREVAIKILPVALASDPDRLARFKREAQVLASLNHPNIAGIYGLEDAPAEAGAQAGSDMGSGFSRTMHAIVMELVDGPTLADRIVRGALPVDESLAIARQIADALEAAHEQGIIHRDLKPANIKVRVDGTVKVLDFGLAKFGEPPSPDSRAPSLSQSPTITTPAMTAAGMILGTAAYMSPEQAKGRPADRRSDIWAFGCVLYEVLTGQRAFAGDDVAETLAAVIRADPAWTALPVDTPPAIARLLRRCLSKDLRQRLQHIGDARLELNEGPPAPASEGSVRPQRTSPWKTSAAVALLSAVVAAGLTAWLRTPERVTPSVSRFSIRVPEQTGINRMTSGFEILLSPDGRTLLFSGAGSGIFKRRMDAVEFEPLRGAEAGAGPFFSPDGAWIGFLEDGKLKKVPAEGGIPSLIAEVPSATGRSTWGDDGSIILSGGGDLYKVAAGGGPAQLLLKAGGADGASFSQPRFVPGSKAILALARDVAVGAVGRIEVIELPTLTRHPLVDGTAPQLTATGELLFQRQGALWGVKFDAQRLAIDAAPVSLIESIWTLGTGAAFSAGPDGSLAYIAGGATTDRTLVWIDRAGKTAVALDGRGQYQSPRLSPDGKVLVVTVNDGARLGLLRWDLDRGTRLRLTTSQAGRRTVWSPDGQQVAFYSIGPDSEQEIYTIPSGGGESRLLLKRPGLQFPDSWSPDGRFLIFEDGEGPAANIGARRDLWLLPLAQGATPRPLLATRFNERGAVFAPNGQQVAFVSDESSREEVYVQPFPGPGPKVAISTNGGFQPVWSRDGRELFYREGDWLMTVPIQLDPFRPSAPQRLFEFPGATYNADGNFADYDVAPDGRVIAARSDRGTSGQDIQIVLNWHEELRRALGR